MTARLRGQFKRPDGHSRGIEKRNLRKFLMECGDGVAFVGERACMQMGDQDFGLNLLCDCRDLQSLLGFDFRACDL